MIHIEINGNSLQECYSKFLNLGLSIVDISHESRLVVDIFNHTTEKESLIID